MTNQNKINKILIVYKKSALQEALDHNNRKILDLVENDDPSVANYIIADKTHKECLKNIREAFDPHFIVDYQYDIIEETVNNYDLIVTVGGDGTFLWASKFVDSNIPILGVNSSPKTSVGFFTAVNGNSKDELFDLAQRILQNAYFTRKIVDRLSVSVNGKIVQDHILNDILFAAEHPAAMTNYTISIPVLGNNTNKTEEIQRSSGVWISAPGGSTGANLSAGGWALPLEHHRGQYIVREPMKNFKHGTEYKLTHGFFDHGQTLDFMCKIRKAILACDGTYTTIPVTIGDHISVFHSKDPLIILGK